MSQTVADELVDLIAVARFVKGDDVWIAPEPSLEWRVAIHEARSAGTSIDSIAKRLRVHDRKVKAELNKPWPTDRNNRPIRCSIYL